MEEVTITKFKSLNGNTYDSKEQCEKADEIWKEENEYNVEADIKRYKFEATRVRKMEEKYPDRYSNTYPKLYTWKDKHGDWNFVALNFEGVLDGIWVWFENLSDKEYGYYQYEDRAKHVSARILETEDKDAAYGMIMSRSDYEYETVDFEHVDVFGGKL